MRGTLGGPEIGRRAAPAPRPDAAAERALALEEVRANDLPAATRRLVALLRDHPGYGPAMSDLAVLLHRQGDGARARALLRSACSRDPGCVEAWENLLDLTLAGGDTGETRRLARVWVGQRPDEPAARARAAALGVAADSLGMGRALAAGDAAAARRAWCERVREDPGDPRLLDLAVALLDAEAALDDPAPAPSGPPPKEVRAADLVALLPLLRGRDGSRPIVAVLEENDPLGDVTADAVDEVSVALDLGNVRLLAATARAAALARRAGLDVRGSLDDLAPEEIERIRDEVRRPPVALARPPEDDDDEPVEVPVHLSYPASALDLDRRAAVRRLLRDRLDAEEPRLLDAEAGEGRLLADLASIGRAAGVEPTAWRRRVARVRVPDVSVEILEGNLLVPGGEPRQLGLHDAIVAPGSLSRLGRHAREGALLRLAAHLAPGGLLLVEFPHRPAAGGEVHGIPRTREELLREAEAFGFEVVEVAGIGRDHDGGAPARWIAALRPGAAALARLPDVHATPLPPARAPSSAPATPLPVLVPLAPRGSSPAATAVPPLLWCGATLTPGGYATYNRNSILWLRRAGFRVGCRNHDEPDAAFLASLPHADLAELRAALRERIRDGFLLVNYQPALPTGRDVYAQMRWQHPEQRAYVGLTTFETDSMPHHWVAPANAMDEIWVPSTFNIGAFARAGIEREKLRAIGFAIDAGLHDPERVEPAPLPGRRSFVFLSVFQWHGRKGWRFLVEAWARTFSRHEDVELVVKTMRGAHGALSPDEQISEHLRALGIDRAAIAPIRVLDTALGEAELRRLYRAADAFVLPTRGEGWGIPYLEAMAAGLPAIGTRWSGHLDFMDDENSYLVDIEGLSVVDREMLDFSPEYAEQRWATPDVGHLVEILRRVRERPEEARARGERARRDVIERWTPERYVERVRAAALDLEARVGPGRRRAVRARPLPSVTFRGPLLEGGGRAHDARTLVTQLASADVPVDVDAPIGADGARPLPDEEAASLLIDTLRSPGVVVEHGDPRFLRVPDPSRHHVVRVATCGDRLPQGWLEHLEERDEIWVPGRFHRESLERAGVDPARIRCVPIGVDVARFHPGGEPFPIAGAAGVVFLACLDPSPREGWDVLVRAFFGEFGPEDGVHLVLDVVSTQNRLPGDVRRHIEDAARRAGRLRWGHESLPLTVLPGTLDPEEMPGLLRAADVLVVPARASRTGLTALEAMACGTPVLAVGWGAHTDFADGTTALHVAFDLVPASLGGRREDPDLRGQLWAEPRLEDFRRQLRRLASDPALRADLGRRGRERAVAGHSQEVVREAALAEIRRIGREADGSRVAPRPVRVCWRGPQQDGGSLAHVNRSVALHLEASCGVTVERRIEDLDAPVDADVVVSHGWPPAFRRPPGGAPHVVVLPWEYGRIPSAWVGAIEEGVDEIWVPSHHVLEGLVASGVPAAKVHVVPNGVDPLVFRPRGPKLDLPTRKTFRFLFVGGAIWRKGVDLLLGAYDGTFRPEHDVCLVVKDVGAQCAYRECSGIERLRERAARPDRPELLLLEDDLGPTEMGALYRACDVLVHPYRAEGFALPVAEAGACGLPVLATEGGATADFHSERAGWLLRSRRVSFVPEHPYETDGWVLEPDPLDLARRMLEAWRDPAEGRRRGREAAARLALTHRWSSVAGTMAARLRRLASRPATTSDPGETTERSDR